MNVLALPKAKAKLLRKLEQKKYRYEFGLYISEGLRSVSQQIQSAPEYIEFIVQTETSTRLNTEVPTFTLPENEFDSFSQTQQNQGILAVVKMPAAQKWESVLQNKGIILALDAVQDPGNLGTIIRNSFWFGIEAIVLGTGTTDLFNPKTVRSCMSSLASLNYVFGELPLLLNEAELLGWDIFLLSLDEQAKPIQEVSFPEKTILVLGNEGLGISDSLLSSTRMSVLIPGSPKNETESLNVGVASSIALYEVMRQKTSKI